MCCVVKEKQNRERQKVVTDTKLSQGLLFKIMDSQKANGISPKENGSKRRPQSYSVETPYGFHLDLDFLKYVEDIEKGNTIRRVPMHRRQRGRNNGILSRNLSLPGYGCRSAQWNSISTLWPKSHLGESHQHLDFSYSENMSAGYARRRDPVYKPLTTAEMDASIQAFDEQPLGCYVRTNLLRASSLPLTVLLRKHSESTEDPTSPSSPKEYLSQENGSSDDVFNLSYSRTGGANGTIQRLTAALQRVGELEAEIRVIPELKAQICILQEERERLLLQLHSQNGTTGLLDVPTASPDSNNCDGENKDQPADNWMNREYDRLEKNIKDQVDAVATPRITHRMLPQKGGSLQPLQTVLQDGNILDEENKNNSLTQTLQKKVFIVEQELCRREIELEKTRVLFKQQVEESRLKDEKIKQLTINLDTVCTVSNVKTTLVSTQNIEPVLQSSDAVLGVETREEIATQDPRQPSVSHADMEHHVKRLQELLQEQWECLCRHNISGKISSEHLPSRVCTIQEQLVTLVTLLSLYVFPFGETETESKMEEHVPSMEHENLKTEISKDSKNVEHSEEDFHLKNTNQEADKPDVKFSLKVDPIDEDKTKQEDLHKQTSEERYEQVQCRRVDTSQESQRKSEENMEAVKKDFIEACYFLKDHVDKVSEPDDEMSKALTIMFQHWFCVSAEEDSRADIVSLYLSEVNSQTPTVLPFLINMVDDNGNTALHYSASHLNFSIVKLLLDTGMCNIDLKNKSGYTAIMLASLTSAESPGDLKVLQQLMELGDVNSRIGQVGQTALHLAVRHGRVPIVRLLLAKGADPNAQDHAGTTPLIIACDRRHVNIVQILLEEANCDINLKDKGGRSALSLATQACHTEIADLLKARTETKSSDKCKVS